MFLEHISFIEV